MKMTSQTVQVPMTTSQYMDMDASAIHFGSFAFGAFFLALCVGLGFVLGWNVGKKNL